MSKENILQFDPRAFCVGVNGVKNDIKFGKGQTLFVQGDPADALFYIQEGKIKVSVLSGQGKEAVIAVLGAGDFCGEGCLGGQSVRMSSVVAMSDCLVTRMEKAAVISMLHDRRAFSEQFMVHLLTRNIRVEEDLIDQLFNSSEKRLARIF